MFANKLLSLFKKQEAPKEVSDKRKFLRLLGLAAIGTSLTQSRSEAATWQALGGGGEMKIKNAATITGSNGNYTLPFTIANIKKVHVTFMEDYMAANDFAGFIGEYNYTIQLWTTRPADYYYPPMANFKIINSTTVYMACGVFNGSYWNYYNGKAHIIEYE